MVQTSEGRFGGWETLLEFARLPENRPVLCAGSGAEALAGVLAARGHPARALTEPARGAAGGRSSLVEALDAAPEAASDGSGRALILVDALHREPDPEAALAAARRVAGPGGLLLIREPMATAKEPGRLTQSELGAHLAGEGLAVLAHRQLEGAALWLLEVPRSGGARRKTFLEEDR